MSYKPNFLKKVKRIQSAVHHQDLHDCLQPTPSPAFQAKFYANEEQQFRVQWRRIQQVVVDLYGSFERAVKGPEESIWIPNGTLLAVDDDVHMLLHSKVGCFIFDFIVKKILPAATQMLYQSILDLTEEERNNFLVVKEPIDTDVDRNFSLELFVLAWDHFYGHILPDLEMIFVDVVSHSNMSMRLAALLAFRDGVVLNFLDDLIQILQDQSKIKRHILSLRHMFLILQNATERCPTSEYKQDLEKALTLIVKPYLSYRTNNSYESLDSSDVNSDDLNISEDDSISLPSCALSSPGGDSVYDFLCLPAENEDMDWTNRSREGKKRSISTPNRRCVRSFEC